MDIQNEEPLQAFGHWLMSHVRDSAILQWDKTLKGQMLDGEPNRLDNILASLGEKEQQIVLALVPKVVDTTLHYLLAGLEHAPNITVAVGTSKGKVYLATTVAGDLPYHRDIALFPACLAENPRPSQASPRGVLRTVAAGMARLSCRQQTQFFPALAASGELG